MRWLVSALVFALGATLAPRVASTCPAMVTSLRPLATRTQTMLPDGGVLLTVSRGIRRAGTFALVDETGSTLATVHEPIAPGLVRLAPTQHADREVSFTQDGTPLFVVQDAAAAPLIAVVPEIARVTSTRSRSARPVRSSYRMPESTTITLASAPPADTAAIVLYGADGAARAWVPTSRSKRYTVSLGGGKGCGGVGMSGTVVGEDVTLAFVNGAGRVSAPTTPVRVKKTPPPPKPASPPPVPTPRR